MIVLDANILVRAVLGRRVRQLVDTYTAQGVRFSAPDVAFNDAQKYLPPLLKKRGKPDADVPASLEYLRLVVETVDSELYAIFEKKLDSACVVATRMIGRCWPRRARIGVRNLDRGCGLFRNWHCSMDYRSHRDLSASTNQGKPI